MMISPGLKVHAGKFSSLITRWRAHWRRLDGGSIGSRAGLPSSISAIFSISSISAVADGAVATAPKAADAAANSANAVAASAAAAAAAAAERRNEEGDEGGDKEAFTTGRGEAFPLVSCVGCNGCVGKALPFCDEMSAACGGRRGDSLRPEARAAPAGRLLRGAPTARATATSIRFCATAGSTYGSVYTEPT